MNKVIPTVNFGQSSFQDQYFVIGQQLTPFRTLRQIELEINQINSALMKQQFNERRLKLKIAKLSNSDSEEDKIDLDETLWDLSNSWQLVQDAQSRLTFFKQQRDDLIAATPQEYWDQGYEAAELEYFTKLISKQLLLARLTGIPNNSATEQLLSLPQPIQDNILKITTAELIKHLPKETENG